MQNMVGPGEVDEDLEPETAEECSKYGKVTKVVIYEVGGTAYWREGAWGAYGAHVPTTDQQPLSFFSLFF